MAVPAQSSKVLAVLPPKIVQGIKVTWSGLSQQHPVPSVSFCSNVISAALTKYPHYKEEERGSFDFQFQITDHHVEEIKAGTQTASLTAFTVKSKEKLCSSLLIAHPPFLLLSRAPGSCLQWVGSSSLAYNQDNSILSMLTGQHNLENSSVESLVGIELIVKTNHHNTFSPNVPEY